MAENLKKNSAPVASVPTSQQDPPSSNDFFAPRVSNNQADPEGFQDAREQPVSLGQELREELDEKIQQIETEGFGTGEKELADCKAPRAIALLVHNITKSFDHSRPSEQSAVCNKAKTDRQITAQKRHKEFFPEGTCIFEFPIDHSTFPSPNYHPFQGHSIFHLDWELMFPKQKL